MEARVSSRLHIFKVDPKPSLSVPVGMTNTVRAWTVIARAGLVLATGLQLAPLGTPPMRRRIDHGAGQACNPHPSSEPTMINHQPWRADAAHVGLFANFRDAIAEASFRAAITQRRYRVRYEPNNCWWHITEGSKR